MAISRLLQGYVWKRCRVHFVRVLLNYGPKGEAFSEGIAHKGMITASLSSVFAQGSTEEIELRWDDLAASLEKCLHKPPP